MSTLSGKGTERKGQGHAEGTWARLCPTRCCAPRAPCRGLAGGPAPSVHSGGTGGNLPWICSPGAAGSVLVPGPLSHRVGSSRGKRIWRLLLLPPRPRPLETAIVEAFPCPGGTGHTNGVTHFSRFVCTTWQETASRPWLPRGRSRPPRLPRPSTSGPGGLAHVGEVPPPTVLRSSNQATARAAGLAQATEAEATHPILHVRPGLPDPAVL